MVAGHREFVRKHPVATDLCALEAERAPQFLVDKDCASCYAYFEAETHV
jgi:hypothetical protein